MAVIKSVIGLLESRKAVMVLAMNTMLFILYGTGTLQWEQIENLLAILNATWFGAHAWEQSQVMKAKTTTDAIRELVLAEVQRLKESQPPTPPTTLTPPTA